jgi:hypothetical protein
VGPLRCDEREFGPDLNVDNETHTGLNLDGIIDAIAECVAAKIAGRTEGGPVSPRLFRVDQAALYIGRTKEAVQHMLSGGKLPTVRPDRRVFIDVRDLDSWIDDNKQRGIC